MNLRHKVVCLSLVLSFFGAGPVWGALGDPLWEQTFNYLPNYDNTQPHSCAASSGILIVCGVLQNKRPPPLIPLVLSGLMTPLPAL